MDSFCAYYEYPSSQAAIHALPARTLNYTSPAKTKRSWGNILKIPGRSKKDRDPSPASGNRTVQATVYTPGFSLPQGNTYASPTYTVQRNHFITSTPYRDPGRNYVAGYREKYNNYNATCGRSSISPLTALASSNDYDRATPKNTVKYTDWFGSVMGKKPPARPALPVIHTAVALPRENNVPTVASWDNYVSIQSPLTAVEIPAILPVHNANICMCPDQLFSTKSKKKKKCKQCGRKYGTVKHATAIGSVTRIRPAIPSNLFQSPSAIWGWPQPTKSVYPQQYIVTSQQSPSVAFYDHHRDFNSSPPTPETIRSTKSGQSNGSNCTIKTENVNYLKSIPPPPNVPLPSIPSSEQVEDMKKASIIATMSTAYDLLASKKCANTSSDTDDLSDNVLNDSWDNLQVSPSKASLRKGKRKAQQDSSRVSVISIGEDDVSIGNGGVSIIAASSSSPADTNKVSIYTDTSDKVVIKNSMEIPFSKNEGGNDEQLSTGTVKVSTDISNPAKDKEIKTCKRGLFQYDWSDSIFLPTQSSSTLPISPTHDTPPSTYTSSQIKKRNKYNNDIRSKASEKQKSELVVTYVPERDNTKVVCIAGQRILFDRNKLNRNTEKSSDQYKGQNQVEDRNDRVPEIGDWEPLHEESPTDEYDEELKSLKCYSASSVKESNSQNTPGERIEKKTKRILTTYNNCSYKPSDHTWNIISTDIRDTIHEEEEEEEEYEEDCEGNQNKRDDGISATLRPNGVIKSDTYGEQDGDKDTSSTSTDSPERGDGFQPTLSELLQVKSILKRPYTLDTSSETDSDFYFPTFSEYKQNLRKKKSVQFRQSHEVSFVEDALESKGKKVSSLRPTRRERDKKRERLNHMNEESDISHNALTAEAEAKITCRKNLIHEYKSDCTSKDEETVVCNGEKNLDYSKATESNDSGENRDCETTDEATSHTTLVKTPESSEVNLRRSHSHRQTFEVKVPEFSDTYRLRQVSSRPAIPLFDQPPPGKRRPIRKAPPPPRKSTSPVRPTVPPPPPPPSSNTSANPPTDNEQVSNNILLQNEASSSNGTNSSSSSLSSLSPPPSPPPPLPSSPPPLPSSSPPPLDDEAELPSPEITFSSFREPIYTVSVSSKMLQIIPKSKDFSSHQVCDALPSSRNGSVFEDRDEIHTATIRGRVNSTKPCSLAPFQSLSESTNTFNNHIDVNNVARKPKRNLSPIKRSSFLSSMVEEGDHEERFIDHIYEELPSLPSSPSGSTTNNPSSERSMFDGASKYEILEYLQDARNRVNIAVDDNEDATDLNPLTEQLENIGLEDEEDPNGPDDTLLPSRYMDERSSNRSSNSSESSDNCGILRTDKERLTSGEIERTDSGVGSETSKPTVTVRRPSRINEFSSSLDHGGLKEGDLPPCNDCDSPVEAKVTKSGLMYAPLVCRRCYRRRQERKEILTEIMETEIKYGRDLRVIIEQFYRPMRVASLITKDQLEKIFLNIEELIEHNRQFALQIKDAYEIALDQGDEDLLTVNVARLFLNAGPMLRAFQNYCVRQGAASILLQNLEKEKELLRIFLRVSQMENTLLRRMNLHSFLMVPVQRVTKYPLLLARLYKATPPSHSSREDCRRAREKIELFLQHINNETKELSPAKLWRRISMSVGNNGPLKWSLAPPDYDTSIKLRSVALEILDWSTEDATIIREGRLLCLPPESTNWTRRGRGIKMATVQMVLITLGSPKSTLEETVPEDGLVTPRDLGIKEAAILAFKDHRLTKTALIRDPWLLSRVVVTWDAEGETECFELTDLITKDTYIFKDRECVGTEEWFRSVQFHALSVGPWRRRRPALANIMINGTRKTSK